MMMEKIFSSKKKRFFIFLNNKIIVVVVYELFKHISSCAIYILTINPFTVVTLLDIRKEKKKLGLQGDR